MPWCTCACQVCRRSFGQHFMQIVSSDAPCVPCRRPLAPWQRQRRSSTSWSRSACAWTGRTTSGGELRIPSPCRLSGRIELDLLKAERPHRSMGASKRRALALSAGSGGFHFCPCNLKAIIWLCCRAHILAKKVTPRAFVEQPNKKGQKEGEVGIEGTTIQAADAVSPIPLQSCQNSLPCDQSEAHCAEIRTSYHGP